MTNETEKTNKIFYYEKRSVSINDAVNTFLKGLSGDRKGSSSDSAAGKDAVALLFSPRRFRIALFYSNGFHDASGKEIAPDDLASVYAARFFNEEAELRWQQRPGGDSEAIVICEQQFFAGWDTPKKKQEYIEAVDQRYICWGRYQQDGVADGADEDGRIWGRLVEDRIDSIPVPVGASKGDRIQLIWKEYLAVVDEYDNVASIDERLLRFERYIPRKQREGQGGSQNAS